LLLNTQYYNNFLADSSTYNFTVTNSGNVIYRAIAPAFTVVTPGFVGTGFTINMTSASAKIFSGNGGTYPTLNQGGGPLTITGTNTFNNITNTLSGATITFPSSTTTTFNNFSLAGFGTGGGASTGYPLGSVSLNGTSQYLNTTAIDLTSVSAFTVEAWVYLTATSASQQTIVTTRTSVSVTGWEFRVTTARTVEFYFTGTAWGGSQASTTVLALNRWYHVAFVRNGSTAVLYVNGVGEATATSVVNGTAGGGTFIGNESGGSVYFNGYISNLRIASGVAVYTGNFTVPTDPLSATQSASTNIAAITGTQTSLLLNTPNSANFIRDSSVNNFTVTNNGTATANSLSPFLMYINSTTSGTSATITKSSGIVYGSSLSIQDSTATGGATWYAGPTSVSVSNNTGWIFNQLPIINMGNVSINGGITFS
jgi:hypothetical protein